MARFWFERTRALVPNHLLDTPLDAVLPAGVPFEDYRLRVVSVIRDYGMFDRDQAPEDSKDMFDRAD